MICMICGEPATFFVGPLPMCDDCTDTAVETAIDLGDDGECLDVTPIEEAHNDDK